MKVFLAADHAGFPLKQALLPYLRDEGFDVEDLGAHQHTPDDDYPDFIARAAEAVSKDPENARAIVLGGSGQGEAIVANRFKHVRAAVYYGGETSIIALSREHNDANVLSLGARFLKEDEAKAISKKWLNTAFSGDERHVRRIKKIEQYGG